MLTKIGVAALLGTIGTAAVGGTASAHERREPIAPVTIAAPAPLPVAYGYGTPGVYYRHDRREEFARRERERREEAFRHAAWLRHHQGWGYGNNRR